MVVIVRKVLRIIAARVFFLPNYICNKILFSKNFTADLSQIVCFMIINADENHALLL